ncbi:D-Tyr tRNAtyr deacylase-like domain-containing protein [Lipomyces japonicus]|uniref:D-Tyr tRNAtyr deacylase-like domain-containing protein n=1 Tax=Lipomyces japonicus TaxID=56871 RepID=UPI0034CDBF82
MKAVVQRVISASVTVEGKIISSIQKGLLVLIGVESGDTFNDGEILANKIVKLKVFPGPRLLTQAGDEDETALPKQWDRSVLDIDGEILCISQFTLMASVKKSKPSFHRAESPKLANQIYEHVLANMRIQHGLGDKVKDGQFGAYMQVGLVNDGPVTIELASR